MPWIDDTFETESWPEIRAANHGGSRTTRTRGATIHTPEAPEGAHTARNVANYFASGETIGSTHTSVDSDEIIQCVPDSLICHGAPGTNHSDVHVEIGGYAGQSRAEWDDQWSRRAVDTAANNVAQWALKYGFPIRRNSVDELRRGVRGIVDHNAVRLAFGRTTHTDVGPNFPWPRFLHRVDRWHRHWLSTHPDFDPKEGEPDFRVVVLASADPSADVDEGMARLYARRNALKFLEWPITSVTFGAAVIIGSLASEADQIEKAAMSGKIHVISGRDRDATAAKVLDQILQGKRKLSLPY